MVGILSRFGKERSSSFLIASNDQTQNQSNVSLGMDDDTVGIAIVCRDSERQVVDGKNLVLWFC